MERSFLPLEQLRTIVLQITLMAPWLLIFHFGFRLEKQKALRLWSSPKLSRVFWTYGLITRIYLAEMYSTSDKVIFQPPKAQFFKTNSIDFYLFSNGCIFFSTLILLSTIISLLPERLFVNQHLVKNAQERKNLTCK